MDGAVCHGIQQSLQYCHAKGARPTLEKDAVDFILTAVCFSEDYFEHSTKMGQKLGVGTTYTMQRYRPKAKDIKTTGTKFHPKREARDVIVREEKLSSVMMAMFTHYHA